MIEYRVTKYDPALRDSTGAYVPVEWTSVSDIGRAFHRGTLTSIMYQAVEQAYVSVAQQFMEEAQQEFLQIMDLESSGAEQPSQRISVSELGSVLRPLLREEYWCRLENTESFVHVGYDYYMYIGVPARCEKAEALAASLGLFVELFQSPYRTKRARSRPTTGSRGRPRLRRGRP